ncbi:hypothetical protein Pen02_59000 [Plantactinospora endophytica]|uniref:Endonuclease/exonuclease/phosphatase domain-containing protein n=1 Tax=Plantactinospora endophytica TaxID=673535 RepID=A0ABQ4E8I7_9ACTN|nr:hypothetical protein Pen02_59000 [Plantactinospora endophytica]
MREIVRLVHEHAIDVLALQEVDFTAEGESEILLALLAQTELQYAATLPLSESSFESGGRAGVAVVSRHPVGAIDSFYLRNPRLSVGAGQDRLTLHDKGAVTCTIDFGLDRLSVVSFHSFPFHRFGHSAQEPGFKSIWDGIGRTLSRLDGRRLVLCGDFNTEDRGVILNSLSFPMTTTFSGRPTHNGKGFDDVLYSPDFAPVNRAQLIPNFSDHSLCLAELALCR